MTARLVRCAGDRGLPTLHVWPTSQDTVQDWRPSPDTDPAGALGLPWPGRRPLSSAGPSAVPDRHLAGAPRGLIG
jgi:hypothetical protein